MLLLNLPTGQPDPGMVPGELGHGFVNPFIDEEPVSLQAVLDVALTLEGQGAAFGTIILEYQVGADVMQQGADLHQVAVDKTGWDASPAMCRIALGRILWQGALFEEKGIDPIGDSHGNGGDYRAVGVYQIVGGL